jgi:hypothetical protein
MKCMVCGEFSSRLAVSLMMRDDAGCSSAVVCWYLMCVEQVTNDDDVIIIMNLSTAHSAGWSVQGLLSALAQPRVAI